MLETENTNIANKTLAKYSDKPIVIKSTEQWTKENSTLGLKNFLGVGKEFDNHFMIAVNYNKPESIESTYVHEVLHLILAYEGFPKVYIDNDILQKTVPPRMHQSIHMLAAYFDSTIDHPEIYTRMKDGYNLDMESYFGGLLIQKQTRFNSKRNGDPNEVLFDLQQNILDSVEYFYYQNKKEEILTLYKGVSPRAYSSSVKLNAIINKIGFSTPAKALKMANEIMRHIIRFGVKRQLHPSLTNLWKSLVIK